MSLLTYHNLSQLSPRNRRLAKEHMLLDELCRRSDKISYTVTNQLGNRPPEGYRITYRVKSITGIGFHNEPILNDEHIATIMLPPEYPGPEGAPICYMLTDVWHPNIRYHGHHKGRICVTSKALGAWHSLDMLVLRIGEILQYKNYLAQNIPPYPEDEKVAKWVREYAEPRGIVNIRKGMALDHSELLLPLEGFEPRQIPLKENPVIRLKRKDLYATPTGTTHKNRIPKRKRIRISLKTI